MVMYVDLFIATTLLLSLKRGLLALIGLWPISLLDLIISSWRWVVNLDSILNSLVQTFQISSNSLTTLAWVLVLHFGWAKYKLR